MLTKRERTLRQGLGLGPGPARGQARGWGTGAMGYSRPGLGRPQGVEGWRSRVP